MTNRFVLFCAAGLMFLSASQSAMGRANGEKDTVSIRPPVGPTRKIYVGSGFDAAIFSTATEKRVGYNNMLVTPRFTYFINFGLTFNYDFNKRWGLYAGAEIKNIGFIEKRGDSTIKRRTYNIGIPLGIKIGNMKSRTFGFAGGGVDVPVNYREKGFVERNNKAKFNEWFSGRTPAVMPYLFCGLSIKPGITFKLQYYLTNYLNTNYTETSNGVAVKPYAGYDVHLLLFSIGISMPYGKDPTYAPSKVVEQEEEGKEI